VTAALYAIMAALLVGLLAAYLAGVKKGAAWGTPLLVLCAVGLVACAVYRLVGRGGGGLPDMSLSEADAQQVAQLLGQGLKEHLEPSARLFVLYSVDDAGQRFQKNRELWGAGLAAGLEDEAIEIVGYATPEPGWPPTLREPGDAGAFSIPLARAAAQFDALVSFTGLPADAEQMNIYQVAEPPKVAAYFGSPGDRAKVRSWLQKGLLQAAVLKEKDGLKLYTPKTLPTSGPSAE